MTRYTGPVKAVIFDWAGTVVDFGSRAPAIAFVELFRRHGVEITEAEARGPMGMHKRRHIEELLGLEAIRARWADATGSPPAAETVDALYAEFIPLQTSILGRHAGVIPGVLETVDRLRSRGIKIGTTTGYSREMMDTLEPEAAANGFRPDAIVTADEVPHGRPAPWMALVAAMRLGVYPMEACVKVGDTVADIAEGLNAGMWTVGVTATGNEVGLSREELGALSPEARTTALARAADRLRSAGAHDVIDGVAGLEPILDEIATRLAAGARP